MNYSGSDDVTAPVQAVDINLVGDRASTSGCEASDFAGFTPGNIALIQRGTCFFRDKVDNAAAAGAVAVIVFNQGNVDPNDDRFGAVLRHARPAGGRHPGRGHDLRLGEALANTAGLADAGRRRRHDQDDHHVQRARRHARAGGPTAPSSSAPTSTRWPRGPGINDNGSGSAAILETALQMAELDIEPTNRVRFAFWGGEEDGLIGSEYYVSQLDARELKQHAVNLNFDMVGSPNFVRFVYDGDGSAFGADRAQRLGSGRAGVPRLLRLAGPGDRADRVRRSLRLLRLHQQRHPGRWALHRRRGHQDRRRGGDLRRHRRRRLRPVLPRRPATTSTT